MQYGNEHPTLPFSSTQTLADFCMDQAFPHHAPFPGRDGVCLRVDMTVLLNVPSAETLEQFVLSAHLVVCWVVTPALFSKRKRGKKLQPSN